MSKRVYPALPSSLQEIDPLGASLFYRLVKQEDDLQIAQRRFCAMVEDAFAIADAHPNTIERRVKLHINHSMRSLSLATNTTTDICSDANNCTFALWITAIYEDGLPSKDVLRKHFSKVTVDLPSGETVHWTPGEATTSSGAIEILRGRMPKGFAAVTAYPRPEAGAAIIHPDLVPIMGGVSACSLQFATEAIRRYIADRELEEPGGTFVMDERMAALFHRPPFAAAGLHEIPLLLHPLLADGQTGLTLTRRLGPLSSAEDQSTCATIVVEEALPAAALFTAGRRERAPLAPLSSAAGLLGMPADQEAAVREKLERLSSLEVDFRSVASATAVSLRTRDSLAAFARDPHGCLSEARGGTPAAPAEGKVPGSGLSSASSLFLSPWTDEAIRRYIEERKEAAACPSVGNDTCEEAPMPVCL